MSVRCNNSTNQGLERLTGLVPVNSDYTCTIWMRTMDVLAGGGSSFRNIMAFLDDAVTYTRWAGLFTTGVQPNDPDLEVTDSGGTPSTTDSRPSLINTWVPIAYSRTGNVHSFYYNWKLVDTVTVDITGESLITQYLGGDTQYSDGIIELKYFREWNKAKSLTEIQDEWMSTTVIDTDSLWSDCPLITDADDISGNNRDWTNVNTATFVSGDPFTDFTQFFIVNGEPNLDPTNKGSWNTAPSGRFLLHPIPQYIDIASWDRSESSSTNPYDLGITKIISPPLAAQTISGTINMVIGALESNADANFFTRLYIYVSQGDSETLVRGVLLDFADTSGTEWPTSSLGIGLSSAQALSSLAISDGDYLVIEFGVRALNSTTSTRTATIWRGCLQDNYRQYEQNLGHGDATVTTEPGYFIFSNPIQLASSEILNVNADRAIRIPDSFPYVADQWTPSTYTTTAYFKHTGVGEKFLSAYNGTAASGGNEEPQMGIYIYDGDTPENIGNAGTAQLRAWQWPAHDGIEYFLQCGMAVFLNPPGITMTFTVRELTNTLPEDKEGILVIPDDVVSVNYEQILSYIDPDTGAILNLQTGFPATENGISSRINGNVIMTGNKEGFIGKTYFYDKDLNFLSVDTTTLSDAGQFKPPVSESDNFFYAAQYVSGDVGDNFRLRRWDLDGVKDSEEWDIPLPASWPHVSFIAVNRDDTILYYAVYNFESSVTNIVKSWDLVNNVALPDLYALGGEIQPTDLVYTTDGFIYLCTVINDESIIYKLDTGGNIILSIVTDPAYGPVFHFAMGVDDTLTLTTWQAKLIEFPLDWAYFTFTEYNVNTGAVISQLGPETNDNYIKGIGIEVEKGSLPNYFFGAAYSCPLIILLNPGEPPPPTPNPLSGIYKIIPNSFKNTDTLWINLEGEVTQEVEIPNPFIVTGGIGN